MKVIALVVTGKRYPALWNTEGRRIFGVDWAPVAPLYHVKRERRRLYPVAIGSIIVDVAITMQGSPLTTPLNTNCATFRATWCSLRSENWSRCEPVFKAASCPTLSVFLNDSPPQDVRSECESAHAALGVASPNRCNTRD